MPDERGIGILGAGLTGLTAAYFLHQKGAYPWLVDSANTVGGLARTIKYGGFRFDLGGHRFLTRDKDLEDFVKRLLQNRYCMVNRSSNIYMNQSFINYPLQAWDAIAKLGSTRAVRVIADYLWQKCRVHPPADNLQDWVTQNFGRILFETFFKDYSEKVWGIDCTRIDSDWIAQRIQNLSLSKTITAMISARLRQRYATLTDQFLYPMDGIGGLCEALVRDLTPGAVQLDCSVRAVHHSKNTVHSVTVSQNGNERELTAMQFISTLPLALLIRLMVPAPPKDIMAAAESLRSRDLVLVCLMLNKDKVSKDSWVYFPGKDIPFGRIHEPKNWSSRMAPPGKTAVVAEFFCFKGDQTWCRPDIDLSRITIDSMVELGFIRKTDVLDSLVLRIPNAYPLFEVGYRHHCQQLVRYLKGFGNLSLAGRTGSFRYYNMDQAMLSGLRSAEWCLGRTVDLARFTQQMLPVDNKGEGNEVCTAYSRLAT